VTDLRALIFDFDGLILDTETPEFVAWQEVFAQHGAALVAADWAHVIGSLDHGWDAATEIERATGRKVGREELRARWRSRHAELLAEERLRPGVAALIELAKARGLGLAVASSSKRGWVQGHLERLGIFGSFDALATGDEVERTKPDPALYTLAVTRLGVPAVSALALEDSPNGIRAAQAAGLRCVAVPNDVSRHLDVSAADLVLDSLADLDIDALPSRA
jgi:HAD superfamily hydrolase (TIGR01509 family)